MNGTFVAAPRMVVRSTTTGERLADEAERRYVSEQLRGRRGPGRPTLALRWERESP